MTARQACALAALLLALGLAAAGAAQAQGDRAPRVTVLQRTGGRVSWNHKTDVIAFDATGEDGYADVCTIRPDGSELRALTAGKDGLVPQLHNGNPTWHSSGEYMVFQAQDPELEGLPAGAVGRFMGSPGIGINNNLWIANADGSRFWQLTHVEDRHGALHPQFSHDGSKLLWSEAIGEDLDMIGHWAIKLADFAIEDGEPRMSNVQTLAPGDLQLYEVHGFSPDDERIIFSGVPKGEYYYSFEIYTLDLARGELRQLTDNDDWDEHAHFSPDGRLIIWASTTGIPQTKTYSSAELVRNPPRLDYWVMNADGSNKRRLTRFNDPNAPEYVDSPVGVGIGDLDWGPDGRTIVAKMRAPRQREATLLIGFFGL